MNSSMLSRTMFAISALVWSVTILFVPDWWASPAFNSMGLTDWMAGLLWGLSALLLGWSFRSPQATITVAGLSLYAVPTVSAGCSIVWWTLLENNVAAMGSAVAWLTLGVTAMARAIHTSRSGVA